jgi:MFS family permease
MVVNLLITPLTTLLPYFIKFDHLGGAADLALVEALFEGGMLAGGLAMSIVGSFKRKVPMIAFSFYAIFIGYLFIALAPTGSFLFLGIAGLIAAIFIPILNVLVATIIQTVVPLDMQGRVNSVNLALVTAATPIGMIASGTIVGYVTTNYLFAGCAIAGIMAITITWALTDFRCVESTGQPSHR